MSERPGAARRSMPRGRFLVAVANYATQVLAVADAEARKLRHDPWELLRSRSTQVNRRTFNPFAKPESAARGQNGQRRRLTCEIDLLLAMD